MLCFILQFISHHPGRPGEEVKAETKAEHIEERCYWLTHCGLVRLAHPLWLGQIALSSPTHSRLGSPTSTSNKEDVYTDMTMGQSDGGNVSVKILFPNWFQFKSR